MKRSIAFDVHAKVIDAAVDIGQIDATPQRERPLFLSLQATSDEEGDDEGVLHIRKLPTFFAEKKVGSPALRRRAGLTPKPVKPGTPDRVAPYQKRSFSAICMLRGSPAPLITPAVAPPI